MPSIVELRQREHEARATGRTLVAEAERLEAVAARTPEQDQRLAALAGEIAAARSALDAAAAAVAAEESRMERRRGFDDPAAAPGAPRQTSPAVPGAQRPAALSVVSREPDPARSGGFRNLADFALSVMNAHPARGAGLDPRLAAWVASLRPGQYGAAPTNYHQESGADEGIMVPPAFRDTIFELVFAADGLLSMVDVEPTSGSSVNFGADETTPWGTTGVQARWRSEASQMTASKLVTQPRTLGVHELYAFVTATDELLQDAPRLNDRLTRKSADAINYKVDEAIMWGTGAGQPLGWAATGAAAKVSQAKESGQTAATINATNVAKMFSRMLAASIVRARWFINPDAFNQLMLMTIGDQPIFIPPNGFQSAPGGVLLGRPVLFSEHCQTLGTQGDIQFVDPLGYYGLRRTTAFDFASSMHLYFDYAVTAFRWTFRFGGMPFLSAPITPPKSAVTKSHFVLLDTRA